MLADPSFLRLFSAAAASSLGAAIFVVSVAWTVYRETGSALDITYVGLAGAVPTVGIGLVAGVLADRYNRRTMMILSDSARAVALTLFTVWLARVGFDLGVTLATVVVVYGFTATFQPASSAILPRMMPSRDLEDANGLLLATSQGTQVVGAAVGGLLIAFVGVVPGFAVNAGTYVVSALFLTRIPSRVGASSVVSAAAGEVRSFSRDLREGMGYIRDRLPLLEITLGSMPVNFLGAMVFSFLVVYNASNLSNRTSEYAFLVAGIAAGIALGALAVGRFHARRVAGPTIALGILVAGLGVVGLALSRDFYLSLGFDVVIGVVIGLINTVFAATVQAIVPDRVLGRVLSVDLVAGSIATPVGIILGGLLITARGVEFDYLVSGAAMCLNGGVLALLKGVRSLRVP